MIKLGCATWSFSKPHYQPPYEDAIRLIHAMGFAGMEMIIFEEADMDAYYTPDRVRQLRALYEGLGLELTEFAVYTPVIEPLCSFVEAEREQAFALFCRAVDIGHALGARAMNLVAHWPYGTDSPTGYPSNYFLPYQNLARRATPTLYMDIPACDYDALWTLYVEMLRRCLRYVQSAGMEFYIEGHANVIVGNSDAMLRLFDNIPDADFGVNFDTAWHLIQREYPQMALRKLGRRVRHLHLRDGDGMANYKLPCGMGIIDWVDVFKTLDDIGFDGYASFEIGAFADMEQAVATAKRHIEWAMGEAGLPIP